MLSGFIENVDSQTLDERARAADDNGLQSKDNQYTNSSAYNKLMLISGPACMMATTCFNHANACSMTTTFQSVVLGQRHQYWSYSMQSQVAPALLGPSMQHAHAKCLAAIEISKVTCWSWD